MARRLAHFLSWVGWLGMPFLVLAAFWLWDTLGRLSNAYWEGRIVQALITIITLILVVVAQTFRGIGVRFRWDEIGWIAAVLAMSSALELSWQSAWILRPVALVFLFLNGTGLILDLSASRVLTTSHRAARRSPSRPRSR